jgi:class 3 adenylate cyclase
MCVLFAATYPERTTALLLVGSYAKRLRSQDYPWAPTVEQRAREIEETEATWGSPEAFRALAPSKAEDQAFQRWIGRYLRQSASPKAAAALMRMNTQIDVRDVLPTIGVPTLLIYRTDDADVQVDEGRYIAERIPGSRFVELPGVDHLMWTGDTDALLDEIEGFLTGVRRGPDPDRVLATVLFTDVVGSTETANRVGDRAWRSLLDRHHQVIRRELDRWRGREIDTAGDGFLATFDGPARGIRCAVAATEGVRDLGLEIRAGLHTGEVEIADDNVRGIAVHIGSRVSGLAGPGEVLVSRTVADLVAGSGIVLAERGEHDLKGVPGRWLVYAVESV